MSIDELLNKSVYSDPTSKARSRKIRLPSPNHDSLDWILVDVYWCYKIAGRWDYLSPTERIMTEQRWTESILKLLSIGNSRVMHNIRYRLREQTPDEDAEERG